MSSTSSGKVFKPLILFLAALICVYLFLHSSIFQINHFEVEGNKVVSRDEILALAGIKNGENIFRVDKTLTARSISVHPMIKNAEIKRKLPSTVVIKVNERKIWAVVPYQGLFLCIDNEGICIDRVQYTQNAYPILTMDQYPDRVNLGQAVNPQATRLARKIWGMLPAERRENISEFHYINRDKSLLLYTVGGTEIRFGKDERTEEKIETIIEVMRMEEDLNKQGKEKLQYVDIRYKGQPVIKTR